MVADTQDIAGRLRSVLPTRWFPDATPVLDALLLGLAAAWSWCFGLIAYVRAQTRIATATDVWLDIVAEDFFGSGLARRVAESDAALRLRIQQAIFQGHATRTALARALIELTGQAPIIFEPARTMDTGGYGGTVTGPAGLYYGQMGGWGSLELPFQCFVTAFRPTGSGIAMIEGWGAPAAGYGLGAMQYATLAMVEGQVTDLDINAAIAAVMPAATISWARISS
jgi:hypothetical protein